MHDDEKPVKSTIHQVLDQIADAEMSDEYWDKLFNPLRDFLINRLRRYYSNVPEADLADASDEIILRLYRYFDFSHLQGLSDTNRRKRFYSFVKRTIYSVMIDLLRQKGMINTDLPAPMPTAQARAAPHMATELVADAFNSLPPEDQKLLRYKIIERLAYKDIQDLYLQEGQAVSIGALKMRALRALNALRQILSRSRGA